MTDERYRDGRTACQWWVLCDHAATTDRDAGPLGMVPICERCDAKVDAIEAPARRTGQQHA